MSLPCAKKVASAAPVDGMEMSIPSHARLTVNALRRKKVLHELIMEKQVVEVSLAFFEEYRARINDTLGNGLPPVSF